MKGPRERGAARRVPARQRAKATRRARARAPHRRRPKGKEQAYTSHGPGYGAAGDYKPNKGKGKGIKIKGITDDIFKNSLNFIVF